MVGIECGSVSVAESVMTLGSCCVRGSRNRKTMRHEMIHGNYLFDYDALSVIGTILRFHLLDFGTNGCTPTPPRSDLSIGFIVKSDAIGFEHRFKGDGLDLCVLIVIVSALIA